MGVHRSIMGAVTVLRKIILSYRFWHWNQYIVIKHPVNRYFKNYEFFFSLTSALISRRHTFQISDWLKSFKVKCAPIFQLEILVYLFTIVLCAFAFWLLFNILEEFLFSIKWGTIKIFRGRSGWMEGNSDRCLNWGGWEWEVIKESFLKLLERGDG